VLGIFGVETTSFAAVLAGAGLAIGMAFSGTLGSFAAGVMLLAFRPFKVGDVVTVAGVTGKVDQVGIFSTTLDTPDNRRFIIPNASITGSTIENISHHPVRRADVSVGTDYSADVDQTRAVLERVANELPGRLQDKDPQVVLVELGASSVDWQVRIWVDAADFWAVKEAATRAVKVALDEAGIGIPFPQMDVHLDQPAPIPVGTM
jgi:small conductance mechanosensitive channel